MRTPRTSGAAANSPGGVGVPPLGRRIFQHGLQTFVWKADDDNNDELSYDVFYRREGDTAWRLLKADLRDTLLVWDTSSVPNGTYVLKVLASDRRSNPRTSRSAANSKAAASRSTTSRRPCRSASLRKDGTRLRRPGRGSRHRFRGDQGRVLAGRAALAAGVSARRHPRRRGRKHSRSGSRRTRPGARSSFARPMRWGMSGPARSDQSATRVSSP